MKVKFFLFFLMLTIGTWMTPQKASAQVSIDFQVFYNELSPYGNWIDNPDYGYVWSPRVNSRFSPYSTNGYWIYTYEGWTWVSNYSWGWAPFHYGRWFRDRRHGWLWAPDNEWGPGWVNWRRSEGYYGWAPMEPGISISISFGGGYDAPYDQWTFVRDRDFGRTNVNNYYINTSNNITIINNSTVINNTYVNRTSNTTYNAGPDRRDAERRAGRTFTPVAIKESKQPGENMGNGELQLYRPQVQKDNNSGKRPAPSKVTSIDEVKTPVEMTDRNPTKKTDQSIRTQQSDQKRTDPPVRIQPTEQRKSEPPVRIQPTQQKKVDPPVRIQSTDQKRPDPPVRIQQTQEKKVDPPVRIQPTEQRKSEPPIRTQSTDQRRVDPPVKQQQPAEQRRADPPAKQQQPVEKKSVDPPVRQQQPAQQKKSDPPAKQQPEKTKPVKNGTA